MMRRTSTSRINWSPGNTCRNARCRAREKRRTVVGRSRACRPMRKNETQPAPVPRSPCARLKRKRREMAVKNGFHRHVLDCTQCLPARTQARDRSAASAADAAAIIAGISWMSIAPAQPAVAPPPGHRPIVGHSSPSSEPRVGWNSFGRRYLPFSARRRLPNPPRWRLGRDALQVTCSTIGNTPCNGRATPWWIEQTSRRNGRCHREFRMVRRSSPLRRSCGCVRSARCRRFPRSRQSQYARRCGSYWPIWI